MSTSLIRNFYQAKIGGTYDTSAVMALGLSFLASTPPLAPFVPTPITACMALAGSWWLASRITEPWRSRHQMPTALKPITSAQDPLKAYPGQSGLLIGYTTDKGEPVHIPDEDLMRHGLIVGQSGVGKTVLGNLFFTQQIQRGGGLLFVDGKMNGEDLQKLYEICKYCGRERDLLVINPGNPEMSNTYNPILYGDPDEIASRILSLIPSTESSAGADHYKQAANQGITILVAALQKAGLAFNFIDITILLMNPKAMDELEVRLLNTAGDSNEARNLSIFLDQFRSPNFARPDLGAPVDVKKLKEVFGGIGGRLFTFGTGKFGSVLNSYDPEVNLYEALLQNKIIYVMLPTMGKDIAATNFGKMVIGDLRTAVSWLQSLPDERKPKQPFMCFFDEAGSYVNEAWARIFEQARSARIFLLPAVQTLANFKAISDELSEMIVGNTWTKIFFKLGTQETANEAAELIGYRMGIIRSLSGSTTSSASSPLVGLTPEGGVGAASGLSEGEREQEEYRVSPDDLKALDKGECIITYGGKDLFHVKIPYLGIDKATKKSFGPIELNHVAPRKVRGANFYMNTDKYLSKSNPIPEMPKRAAKKPNQANQSAGNGKQGNGARPNQSNQTAVAAQKPQPPKQPPANNQKNDDSDEFYY